MANTLVVALSGLLLVALMSCSLAVDLTGTWGGTISFYDGTGSLQGTYTLTASVTQSGSSLAGSWATSLPSSGTLSGTVANNQISNLTFHETSPSIVDFVGSASIENNSRTITGGAVPVSGAGTISFSVNRQ